MGFARLAVRRHLDRDRLHQCDSVSLAVPRRNEQTGPVSLKQLAR
jgi:hypothetical protein